MDLISDITQIGTLIAALGVLATVWGIRASMREARKALAIGVFTTYTNRYAEIMKELPDELRGKLFDVTIERIKGNDASVDRALALYFDLCAEELYLHEHRMLPEHVWPIWAKQMTDCLRSDVAREYWLHNQAAFASNEAFVTFVNDRLQQASYATRVPS